MSYPETSMRQNCFASNYAEIAIRSYYEIKEVYDKYKGKNGDAKIFSENQKIQKNQMICCVFAEMALESYFNDYAAACLGDKEFYDEFDKLSVIGKFQLIAKFILHKEFDKSKAYYSSLKTLTRDRNYLVHNKSTEVPPEIVRAYDECWLDTPVTDFDLDRWWQNEFSRIKEFLRETKEYVKAMVYVAKFFHEYDEESKPFVRLFVGVCNHPQHELAKKFSKEFGFKWGKDILGLHD